MKAAVLTALEGPLEIWDLVPPAPSFGQVHVRIVVSGLCGAQIQEISGLKGNAAFLPHLLGHEGFGVVEQVGPGVTKVAPGDHVVLHWRKGAGIEAGFARYGGSSNDVSGGKVVTLAEEVVVSENRVTKVASHTSPYVGALLGCGLSTALSIVTRELRPVLGAAVLVVGCGGVGLGVIAALQAAGADRICGLDRSPHKEQLARGMGATEFVIAGGPGSEDFTDTFSSDHSVPFDAIVDTTGDTVLVSSLFSLLADGGEMVAVAQGREGSYLAIPLNASTFATKGKTLRTTQGGGFSPDEDIPRYLDWSRTAASQLSRLVTHSFQLERVNDAVDLLRSGTAGRIMVETKWADGNV